MEKNLQILSETALDIQSDGAPIVVRTLRVAYDYTYNREILFVLCENRSPLSVRSVYFDLLCYDDAGDRLGECSGACMRGLNAAPDSAFGEDVPTVIPFSGTCTVKLSLQKVVFEDNSVWRIGDAPIPLPTADDSPSPIPSDNIDKSSSEPEPINTAEATPPVIPSEWLNPPKTADGYRKAAEGLSALNDPQKSYLATKFAALADKLEADAAEAARREAEANALAARDAEYRRLTACKPETADDWETIADEWKALANYKDAPKRSAEALKKSKSIRAAQKRAADKAAEAARIAAQQKAAKRKARIKAALWIGSTVLVLTALILVTVLVALPASKRDRYRDAEKLIDEGKYTEAISAFEALGSFSDSAERIRQLKIDLTGSEDALFYTSTDYPCFSIENGTLSNNQQQYRITATEIRIPDYLDNQKVTALSADFFSTMTKVTKIILPSSVTSIGDSAFAGCTSLASIEAPGAVKIGAKAFRGCTALTEITLPESLTEIGDAAFQGCSSLRKVVLPESLRKLPSSLFLSCTALTELHLGSRLTAVGDSAFAYCRTMQSITLPETVTSIGNNAFLGCTALTEITLPNGVLTVGDKAFGGCIQLVKASMGSSLAKLAPRAFSGCSALTEVSLPSTLTQIGYSAFENCDQLTTLRFGGSESDWTQVDIQHDNSPLTSVTIVYGE